MTALTALYALLALLAAAAAFVVGRRLGAQQRQAAENRHEQAALQAAESIRRDAQAQAEAVLAQAAQAGAQAQAEASALRQQVQAEAQAARAQAEAAAAALLAQARERADADARSLVQQAEAAVALRRREADEQAQQARAALDTQREQLRERQSELRELQAQAAADRAALEQDRAGLAEERLTLKAELAQERGRLSADRQEYRAEREAMNRELERQSRRAEQLDARGDRLDALEERLDAQGRELEAQQAELERRAAEVEGRVYEIAGLSAEAARSLILDRLDAELTEEKALRVRAMQEKAAKEAGRTARHLIAQAIQRSASETSAQLSVSVVPIPSDAMKGRLIGREGRNIRAFESLTGVDLIIDDTPEAVMLSSFNPIRRAVAQHVLEGLLADGRIHPTRIEEMLTRAQDDMRAFIQTQGEEAIIEAGVVGMKPGLLQLLGRMYFRSSYGQNVLKHSIQVAHLTGIMAGELGLDAALARRCGLLHDIGKSIDREIDGTHVDIGISLAARFGEGPEVIDAIAHHHDPEHGETLYSVLVAAADAISAARPGARREELEAYTRRLERLEEIAVSFPGVAQAYAIQAGREVRVIVQPQQVSDAQATLLARDIAGRIEQDMEYPGQVQVTVVRESRATEVAR